MYILNETDEKIIESIKRHGEFKIKEAEKIEMEHIYDLGVHLIARGTPIIYDARALRHFFITKNSSRKTKRLTPSETMSIIKNPEMILPNFSKGSANSYLYIGKLKNVALSVVEVFLDENKMRVTHGGFEIKNKSYLREAKELRNTILEGRPQK